MVNRSKHFLSLAAIALSILVCSASTTQAQGPVGEVLSRIDGYNKGLQSMRANVTMVKYDSTLKVWDTKNGTTNYLPKTRDRKRYMRLDWKKPAEQMSLIGDDYELYKPSINVLYFGKAEKAKDSARVGGVFALLSMKKAELKENFKTIYVREEILNDPEKTKTVRVKLTPLTAANYLFAELWVDAHGMPRQVMITEKNNDTTTVLLTAVETNVTIKTEVFTLNYPGSVTRRKAS